MPLASVTNPNVCPGCVQLLDDDSPLMMALNTSVPDARAALAHGEKNEPSVHASHQAHPALH